MAKRFTDTVKWTNNKWFFNLSVENKLFWLFLLDSCDQVGVWEENIILANRIIGYEYNIDTLLKEFGDRIYTFKDGRKWWVKDFCNFQYGELKEETTSKPLQSHVKALKNHSLWKEYLKGMDTLKDKDKEKVKDKEEVILPYKSDIFRQSWDKWIKYKKDQHNFKYKSESTEQTAVDGLKDISFNEKEAIAIIDQSIANGWKGFFKLKGQSELLDSGGLTL